MIKKLKRVISGFGILFLACGGNLLSAQDHSPQLSAFADSWAATDALGRTLPAYDEVGPLREGKYVGLFYWTWHASIRLPAGEPPVVQDLIDENPESPAFRSFDYYWGEPENGFYHPSDPWSTRRNLTMIANAGVDFIFLDYTNGPLGRHSLAPLMEVALDLYHQGIPVPRIVFFLNENYDAAINHLMDEFYNRPEYEPLWFYWYGKPLIMADYQKCTEQSQRCGDPYVRDFFTWRSTWAFRNGWWSFIDDYPQRVYEHDNRPEQIAVNKGMGAPLGNGYSKGSSFHDGQMPEYDQYWLPVDRKLSHHGLYFEEHWSRAHEVDPDLVIITGWNEWTAAAWPTEVHSFMGKPWNDPSWRCVRPDTCIHRDANGNHKWPHGWFMVDQFNAEFNRDIEPMKGGYNDTYYYQMVANIRKYKGMEPPEIPSEPRAIQMNDGFGQWADVRPVYLDPAGDTVDRDFQSVRNHTRYVNRTGRNDLVESRVTHDERYLYFYVKTASPLTHFTGDNWMLLFIDSDGTKETGWEGYDYLVNHEIPGQGQTTIKRWENGAWVVDALVDYWVGGAELQIRIPRDTIGQIADELSFEFKWADNIQDAGNLENFFVYGDVAPDRRFNYAYQNAGMPLDPVISRIAGQTILMNESTGTLSFSIDDGEIEIGSMTLSGSSSDLELVPGENIVFGGSGGGRTVTVTPALGHAGSATITVTVSDGSRTARTHFELTVIPDSVSWDFDDGTLQGWTEEATDSQGRQFFVLMPPGLNSPNLVPHFGTHFIGLHIPAFGGQPFYTQDGAHDTLVMRSPEFRLHGEGDLTFWLSGGGSGSASLAGSSVASLPSASSTGGFLGVALRSVTTGTFVLSAGKSEGGNEWEQVSFTEAELGALPRNHIYTLDLIDARHGGWGWVNLDSVTVPGMLAEDFVVSDLPKLSIQVWGESQVRLSWPAAALGWILESSADLHGPYTNAGLDVMVEGDENAAYDSIVSPKQFYRLVE